MTEVAASDVAPDEARRVESSAGGSTSGGAGRGQMPQ